MWVTAMFERLAGDAAKPRADEWLALAREAGPTPYVGKLSHEWLLPSPAHPRQWGLNVFSHDGAISERVRMLLAETARGLGATDVALLSGTSAGVRFNGGLLVDGESARVKVYITGEAVALEPFASKLGLRVEPQVMALGVDFDVNGPRRARSYQLVHTASDAASWPGHARWAELEPAGLSHRLLGRLDPPNAVVAKRSYLHLFRPYAELDALLELAQHVAAIEPALTDCLNRELLSELATRLGQLGLVLRPVCYETDIYGDGSRGTDALVTVGAERLEP